MQIVVAAPGYEDRLRAELQMRQLTYEPLHDQLFQIEDTAIPLAWAVNQWFDVERLTIDSIGHAAKLLRERGPYWNYFPLGHMRRCELIQDKLLKIKNKPFAWPSPKPLKPRGAFALLDEQTLLCSAHCSRPFVDGIIPFEHDRVQPPARAYLKIWEALTLLQDQPAANETVLELGAAPGAWTWALAKTGARINSVDRAALENGIDALPNVFHRQCDAFALKPEEEMSDWLCSDLICYPERLIEMIQCWLAHGHCQKYVITIKFQGDTDFTAIDALQQIPDSWLIHLSNNKHEVCFIKHPKIRGNIMPAWQPMV
jgi:23S rRNA (cytidine2498-2'-O)-methyltransferase